MNKKLENFISPMQNFKKLMLSMLLRSILLLLGTTMYFATSFAQDNEIVSINKSSYGELFANLTKDVNTSFELADFGNADISYPDQQRRVNGRVIGADGSPLPGVNIIEKNTTNGVISSSDGNYSINVTSENSILVFSFIGFTAQEITVGARNSVNVTLIESLINIQEIVIVGYGTQKKETVTGAVTSVASATLIRTPQFGIGNMIAGRLTGILTKQASGHIGRDNSSIRVRGIATFAGNQNPLILVDGIESATSNFMGAQYTYLPTVFNTMDPNDIESITVLKDASSTAVYGVRGANGVILVTTKKGKIGKPEISFTSNVGVVVVSELRHGLDAYNWTKTYNEGMKYDSYISGSYSPKYTDAEMEHFRIQDDPIFYPDTDWGDQFLKPYTFQTQENFNIRGGTKTIRYFISVGHSFQEGLFRQKKYLGSLDARLKYNRYNFRSNFDIDFTKRLSASIKVASQIAVYSGGQELVRNWGYGTVINRLYACNPISSPGIVDGKIVNVRDFFQTNPYQWYWNAGYRSEYINNLNGSVRLNYKLDFITKGLSIRGFGTYEHPMFLAKTYAQNMVTYRPVRLPDNSISYYPEAYQNPYSFSTDNDYNITVSTEYGLDYQRAFGDHNLSGLLLYTQLKQFPGPSLSIPRGFQGLVGRLAYDYKGRYLGEFNAGYNGTENFAKGKRFGFFPAFSLGWVVSKENFFPENKIISQVKLRGSYGEVGNDQVGGSRFMYRPTTFLFTQDWQGGAYLGEEGSTFYRVPGTQEQQWGNPLLTWERAKKTDLGVDLVFLNNKIKITADWFQEKRDNILASPGTVPIIVGASLPASNIGRMKNGGYDGEINYNDRIGKFNFWVSGNFTFVRNKLVFQDEVARRFKYQYRTGKRYGQFFGLLDEGLYTSWEQVNDANRPVSSWNSNRIQPGDIKYKDVNGDGIIDTFDQVPIGYSNNPETIFGISFGGDLKGFDFSILFQGAGNTSVYPGAYSYRGFLNDGITVQHVVDRGWNQEKWDKGSKIDYLPHLSTLTVQTHNWQTSSFWLENAAFLRLRNVEIGYTLKGGLLKRIGVGSTRIYVNGSNLMVWSKLFPGEDPEMSSGDNSQTALNRLFNFGINVNF